MSGDTSKRDSNKLGPNVIKPTSSPAGGEKLVEVIANRDESAPANRPRLAVYGTLAVIAIVITVFQTIGMFTGFGRPRPPAAPQQNGSVVGGQTAGHSPVLTWNEFVPPDKLFRVTTPSAPRKSERMQRGQQVIEYRYDGADYTFVIGRIPGMKEGLDDPLAASVALESISANAASHRSGARLISQTPLIHQGYPGIEVVLEVADQRNTLRFFLCGRDLWAVEFSELHGRRSPAEKQKFLDSFEISFAAKSPKGGAAAGSAANGPATQVAPAAGPSLTGPYLKRRAEFQTKLLKHGSASGEPPASTPDGMETITYESGDLSLNAWLAVPVESDSKKRIPALVYLHDGSTVTPDDVTRCQPFLDAGYALLIPMFRGEHGGPGEFELMWGEVDDARAAIKWLAKQPFIDTERIHTFGYGTGGGIAALLSLYDDIPLRDSGSCSGLYSEASLLQFHEIAPFDLKEPNERRLRLLMGNTREMFSPHFGFLGESDPMNEILSQATLISTGTVLLNASRVPGDVVSSLEPSLSRYLALCQADNGPVPSDSDDAATQRKSGGVSDGVNKLWSSIKGGAGSVNPAMRQLQRQHRVMAEVLEKTASDSPDPKLTMVVAAEAWLLAGDVSRAARVARHADTMTGKRKNDPFEDHTALRIAAVFVKTGDRNEARAVIERLIESATDDSHRKTYQKRLDALNVK